MNLINKTMGLLDELIEAETEKKLIAAKRLRSAAKRSREDDEL